MSLCGSTRRAIKKPWPNGSKPSRRSSRNSRPCPDAGDLTSPILARILASVDCLPQEEFDLRIHTAQIVRGPFLDVFPQIRGYPEQEGLALFAGHVRYRGCRC